MRLLKLTVAMGEPIILFGETPKERHDRLSYTLSNQLPPELEDNEAKEEEFYTVGSNALLECRRSIALFSLEK